VECAVHGPSFPGDPFDDLDDADFSILDLSAEQVLSHQPKPASVRPHVQPPSHQPSPPRKPIVRPAFPDAVPDRSLVHGVSAATVLRTCFRVGEALRAGSRAVHNADDVVIELYARVASSTRDGEAASSSPTPGRHDFTFVDLFHDRPPYLKGVYDLWKGSELWDAESRAFLDIEGEPVLCRCVGKMRRDGKVLLLTVFSVRLVSWEDVEHAKTIICGS
jgi:hypothetical protein